MLADFFLFLKKKYFGWFLPFLLSARSSFAILTKRLCLHFCYEESKRKHWILGQLLGLHAKEVKREKKGSFWRLNCVWKTFFLPIWQPHLLPSVMFQLRKMRGYRSISTSGTAFCQYKQEPKDSLQLRKIRPDLINITKKTSQRLLLLTWRQNHNSYKWTIYIVADMYTHVSAHLTGNKSAFQWRL